VARAYVEHLLGDVACVETVEELEKSGAGRAITPDGVFKQAPLRRRLRPSGTVELTLGREGLERMRRLKLKEQAETRAQAEALRRRLDDFNTWLDQGEKGGLGDARLPDRAGELGQLPQLEAALGSVRATIQLLETPERKQRAEKLQRLENEQKEQQRKIGRLLSAKQNFGTLAKPHREGIVAAETELKDARFEVEASRVKLSSEVTGVLTAELDTVIGVTNLNDYINGARAFLGPGGRREQVEILFPYRFPGRLFEFTYRGGAGIQRR